MVPIKFLEIDIYFIYDRINFYCIQVSLINARPNPRRRLNIQPEKHAVIAIIPNPIYAILTLIK
jgi:hypothetical protein